jgi:hypothetical protein
MNPPNFSRQQWSDLARLLHDTSAKLPKTGNYAPSYEANRCDLDDLYRVFREDATRSQSEVLRLVEEWETQGAWPKGKYKAKFWLRARVEEALAFVQEIVALPSSSAIRADDTLPTDARSVREWLLYTRWDEQLADFWLMENLETYVRQDPNELEEEDDELQFDRWLDSVRKGHYLKK